MTLTPKAVFELMLERHLQHWNWLFQVCGFMLFLSSLGLHSYLLFATGMIFMGAGFFELHLPPLPGNKWTRCLNRTIIKEGRWIRSPGSRKKVVKLALGLLLLALVCWALWTLQLAALLLLAPAPYLIYIMLKNRRYGIEP